MSSKSSLAEDCGESIQLPIVTLQVLLTEIAEKYPDNVALVCKHQPPDFLHQTSQKPDNDAVASCLRWTYSQLRSAAQAFAARLHATGVRKGMRVIAFLRNGAQYAVGIFAAALLGCVFVPVNPAFANKSDEVKHMLNISEAHALMVWDVPMAAGLMEALGQSLIESLKVKIICNDGDNAPTGWTFMSEMLAVDANTSQMPKIEASIPDELALIIFTSGTTSRPKGVKQRNRTLVAGVRSSSQTLALDSSRSFCNNLPPFHIFGIVYMLNFWSRGGLVCFPSETFKPEATLQAIHDEKLTNLAGVPTMMQAIISRAATMKISTKSLLAVAVSGSMLLPETMKQISQGLGVERVGASFGMSEAIPIAGIPYRDLPYNFNDQIVSSGKCSPGARARICAPESRTILERGVAGELHVGGPMVTDGYLGNVSSNDAFYEDQEGLWFVTGDQAVMELNGEIFIQGRYKDLIIRAGENISPASIEAVLDTLPGVTSQVVGVPDEIAGEVPFAVVKCADKTAFNPDSVNEVVIERLGPLFLPAETVGLKELGIEDFPKTDSGKIQKAELRATVAEFLRTRENSRAGSPNRDVSIRSHDTGPPIQDVLHKTWSNLLGMSRDRLAISTSVLELADSITIMRSVNLIRRDLGHTITAQEIMDNPTIETQVVLLQDRSHGRAPRSAPQPVRKREGPPKVTDMAHTFGSIEKAKAVETTFDKTAAGARLSWKEDVEDVVPIWDFGQVLLRRLRAQSWNHRHAWAATRATPKELRSALELALSNQPMLRTVVVEPENSPPLHVIVRPSDRWFEMVITEVEPVKTADDLRQLVLNDPKLDFAAAPGPLFRAIIAPILDTGTSGVVYQAQHSCFDGLSIPYLIEDLKTILSQNGSKVPSRTEYKLFADTLFLHRTSLQAQADCHFHVQRLRGLSGLEKSFWPFQRVPEWFKGNFDDVDQQLIKSRPVLDTKILGVDGITKRTQLPSLQKLKQDHGFSAPAVLKTALALLNASYTEQSNAIFTNYEAARDWPFHEPWIAERLPNAMDVNGPAFEAVLNNIAIDKTETCLQMMERVNEEQKLLTKHAHAPLFTIQEQLGEDGTKLIDTMRRQIFNWLPGLAGVANRNQDSTSPLQRIQMQSRSDVGMLWNCGMLDQETFHMNASYDDAQLRASEVEEAVDRLFLIAQWITNPENWDSAIGQCPLK